jgi:hypothetical protein
MKTNKPSPKGDGLPITKGRPLTEKDSMFKAHGVCSKCGHCGSINVNPICLKADVLSALRLLKEKIIADNLYTNHKICSERHIAFIDECFQLKDVEKPNHGGGKR